MRYRGDGIIPLALHTAILSVAVFCWGSASYFPYTFNLFRLPAEAMIEIAPPLNETENRAAFELIVRRAGLL